MKSILFSISLIISFMSQSQLVYLQSIPNECEENKQYIKYESLFGLREEIGGKLFIGEDIIYKPDHNKHFVTYFILGNEFLFISLSDTSLKHISSPYLIPLYSVIIVPLTDPILSFRANLGGISTLNKFEIDLENNAITVFGENTKTNYPLTRCEKKIND